MSRKRLPDLAPAGFFRFTDWSHARGEVFATWSEHFRLRGVHTVLVEARHDDGRLRVALFVQGREILTEDTFRERRRLERRLSAAKAGVKPGNGPRS
jgi:hypothetical protein